MTDIYSTGRQPCDGYVPQMTANQHATWANVHECFGPYDGKTPPGSCHGTVSFCVRCMTDHHSRGWDACPVLAEDPTDDHPPRRAYLTLSPKFGAGLWLGDRLVARIVGNVEDSRVTPDEPDPLWLRDAMVFVDAVNNGAATPPPPDALREALHRQCGSWHNVDALRAALARLTPEDPT